MYEGLCIKGRNLSSGVFNYGSFFLDFLIHLTLLQRRISIDIEYQGINN